MRIPRVYLDTSVIGGCLGENFKDTSRALIALAQSGRIVLMVSDLLAAELDQAPTDVQRVLSDLPDTTMEPVIGDQESQRLRDLYLAAGVVGPDHANDAHHVALATVSRADMIVSWNFKHIVHFDKIRGSNAVNLREGYPPIQILSPMEVV